MPLDPQAEAILSVINADNAVAEEKIDPVKMRDQVAQAMSAGDGNPVAVASVEDREISGPDGNKIPIRIYKPTETDELLPGVVFFHGGGWVYCNLDTHDGQVRDIANISGAIFISVDYRLAPENPYPAAVDDCYAATEWVAANAIELGIDKERLAVCGDSAGGNLAAVVSQMARDRAAPFNLKFQLLIYPVCDIDASAYKSMEENATGYFLTRNAMEQMFELYVGAKTSDDPYAAPIKAKDLSALPPALIITAEYDPLRDEGEAYGKKLQEAGTPTKVSRYDGMFHGFFAMADFIDKAKDARAEAGAALKEALF